MFFNRWLNSLPPLCPKLQKVDDELGPNRRARNKSKSVQNCTVCDASASDKEGKCDPLVLSQLLGENIKDDVVLCEACHALVGVWEASRKEMARAEAEARVHRRLGLERKEGEVLIGKPLPSSTSPLWLPNLKVVTVSTESRAEGEKLEMWTPPNPPPPLQPSATCVSLLPPVSLFLCPVEVEMLEVAEIGNNLVISLQSVLKFSPRVSLLPERNELEMHSSLLLGERHEENANQLRCNLCSFSTSFFHLLLPHLSLHSSQTESSHVSYPRLECNLCGKLFKKAEVMEAHMKRDHQGNNTPWECDLCGKGFTRKASLEEHVARHQGKKQRHCVTCDKYFYDTAYWRHQATVHPEVNLSSTPPSKISSSQHRLLLGGKTSLSMSPMLQSFLTKIQNGHSPSESYDSH